MRGLYILSIFTVLTFLSGCSKREKTLIGPNHNLMELSGSLSGTLHKNDSPFIVTDHIVVDSLNALVIESGVTLMFSDSTSFEIRGGLSALGESANPITFTSEENSWKGIRILKSTQPVTIRFAIIENVLIDSDDETDFGAIHVAESNVLIQNTIIRENRTINGGGLSVMDAEAVVTNTIFRNNRADVFGGAMLLVESATQIQNNTFYQNECWNYGGGLVLQDPITADIQNNIFFENSTHTGDPRISFVSGDSSKCIIEYNFMWYGNLNPRFVSDTDLHLKTDSPCVDAGNPDAAFNDANGSRNDQGAYGGALGDF